jgi:hypothetical protein
MDIMLIQILNFFWEQILNDSLQFGIFSILLTIHFNIVYYVII